MFAKTKKSQVIKRIDRTKLHDLKIKKWGLIGGCILIPYVITTDGQMFLIS